MHPLHVLLAALSVTTSLAAPSLKSYDEVFPQPKESIKEPYGKEGQGVQFLDLPSLQASNDSNYRLAPQTPGTCVVICVMAPPPDWKQRLGNSMYDNYLQYACAPSCHEDIEDPSQPIKGDPKYPPPGEGSKLKPEDFPVNSVVVTFEYALPLHPHQRGLLITYIFLLCSGIARPGEEGNKDGFSRAERFLISCDADQRGYIPLSTYIPNLAS